MCCSFILSFLIFNLICYENFSQKQDYIWVLGSNYIYEETADHWKDPFQFNFNKDPMELEYTIDRVWDFEGTNSSICDKNGNLLFYSNGMAIFDSTHQIMEGGDSINYGDLWEIFSEYTPDGKKRYGGFKAEQGLIFLSNPEKENEMIYIATRGNYKKQIFDGVTYGNIEIKENRLNSKNIILLDEIVKDGGITATRHENGRDWWLIIESDDNTTYYIYCINAEGIKLVHKQIGYKSLKGYSSGNNMFSLQGDKYVSISSIFNERRNLITLFDFDRSTGILSNVKYDSLLIDNEYLYLGYGVIFSPDGHYLYANWDKAIYRYDMTSANVINSKKLVSEYDGHLGWCTQDSSFCIPTFFGYWQYGPDGRLYNVPGASGARHFHVMNYPDEENPELEQHAIMTPNNPFTIPNFPNFRLGPLDGSPADTLGIDNHPVAKFRYEQDTINHLNVRFTDLSYFRPETWHWDFGDGTTFEGRKPYWHEFPKNGTYNVCLTVSNENSEHTICRMVTIGSTSVSDTIRNQQLTNVVSVFPNPTEGEVLLTVSDYIPEHGIVKIYSLDGKEVYVQRVYYGWNSLDLSFLPAGQYLYEVKDKNRKVSDGKLIKI